MKWLRRKWNELVGWWVNSRVYRKWDAEQIDPAPRKKLWWYGWAAVIVIGLGFSHFAAYVVGYGAGEGVAPVRQVYAEVPGMVVDDDKVPAAALRLCIRDNDRIIGVWKSRYETCQAKLPDTSPLPAAKVKEAPPVKAGVAVPPAKPAAKAYRAPKPKPVENDPSDLLPN
jgi:hypothetical protein